MQEDTWQAAWATEAVELEEATGTWPESQRIHGELALKAVPKT